MKKEKIWALVIGMIFFLSLLVIQGLTSGFAGYIADLFSYEKIDKYNLFARISVHHIVQMLIALILVIILKIKFKKDIGFTLGDKRTGIKHLIIFSIIVGLYFSLFYTINYTSGPLFYSFPLNTHNIIGTLGFQLFLSGPSEEILFRALPITLFIIVFKKSVKLKWGISLEVIIAAILFSMAHLEHLTLFPFSISDNYHQLIISLIFGIAYGVTYQKSGSIIYPMLMHSITNVLSVGIGYIFYSLY